MKKTLTYLGYQASVEFDADDEMFVGHIFGINDIVGFHANTVEDLKTAFTEAVDDYLETCAKIGKNPEKLYSGNLMLRIDPVVHALASVAAAADGKSLNQWSEIALCNAIPDIQNMHSNSAELGSQNRRLLVAALRRRRKTGSSNRRAAPRREVARHS